MQSTEEIIGTIDRFLFQNNENGFCVAVITVRNTTPVTATGYLPGIRAGQQVVLQGMWTMHAKFGKQFEIKTFTTAIPTSSTGLVKYLSSGLIKGIGPTYAQKLVSHFGVDVLTIIDTAPQRLLEVAGIGHGRLQKIIDGWKDQKEIASIMVFLQDKGISPAYAMKIYKQYGVQSRAILQENPYRLADDIWGIGFKMADQIARSLGIDPYCAQRIKAGILFVMSTATTNGHLYCLLQHVKDETSALLELSFEHEPAIKQALHDLYNAHKIVLITHEEQHYITLTQYYASEKAVAAKLLKLIHTSPRLQFATEVLQEQLAAHTPGHIQLNGDQQRGIIACLQNKVTVITGGPGTGKTTLIKQLLRLAQEHKMVFRLAAPTGRAAKRMTEGTGHQAMTLHRLLEYDFATHGFTYNEKNALTLDVLIVDEASMIDIFLAHALLKALPHGAHLVLLGDVDQLPSVGAGNFLNDVIASGVFPCIRLHEVFRQAQNSLIIVNAHRINQGEFPVAQLPEAKKDFFFIKEDDQAQVIEHIKKILFGHMGRYGLSAHDAMILCPLNRGGAGTHKLNHDVQMLVNPDTAGPTITYAGTVFKVGDRVMHIRNNYDKNVFNGDTGIIESIQAEDRTMSVLYAERSVLYESDELDEIVLAYAITVHKSQGSEYPAVIIPLFTAHFTMLARNLIYTAITRAKKLCIIIGQPKALAIAVKNKKTAERITFLRLFLTTDLVCR